MKKMFLFALISAFITSCTKKEDDEVISDTQKPVIELFTVDTTGIMPGGEIHLDFKFTDNQALNQAKFEIHDASGHSHRISSAEFEWSLILDLKGQKSYTDHIHIDVPVDAEPGEYHFTVLVTDKSGNESELGEIDLVIFN